VLYSSVKKDIVFNLNKFHLSLKFITLFFKY
jgi:hypothetical protein